MFPSFLKLTEIFGPKNLNLCHDVTLASNDDLIYVIIPFTPFVETPIPLSVSSSLSSTSVTRWPDGLLNFGHLQQRKYAKYRNKVCQSRFKNLPNAI